MATDNLEFKLFLKAFVREEIQEVFAWAAGLIEELVEEGAIHLVGHLPSILHSESCSK